MSKHLAAGSPGAIRPTDDLERDPGIGRSRGATRAGADADFLEGENTEEGDVANDVEPSGAVDPDRLGRTNP